MKRFSRIALYAGISALAGATGAQAQTFGAAAPIVEHSGNVFHIKACPGLDRLGFARCHAHIVTDSRGNPIEHRAVTRNITPGGFGPSDLQSAYGMTGVTGSSTTTVAIVDAYGYPNAAADLATYRAQFGLGTASLTIINETGGTSLPRTNTGWDQEQALDLDMVSTMCPNCKILLVQATTASNADLSTAVNTAVSNGAHVVSNSYGGGESGSQSYEPAYNHAGVAITASAGDSGYGAQFPATSPHVIAVGGTHLVKGGGGRGWTETVWTGTGSGCSGIYAKPTWQTDGGCARRMEADVSAVADPSTGVAVYGPSKGGRSAWLVFGGTSVAAPLIGGMYGAKSDAVNYAAGPYASPSSFNDVTSGNNGSCGGTYFCTAETGYDGPTGLGTPKSDAPF